MSDNIFKDKWKIMQHPGQEWWSKLTEADLDRVAGNYDQFIALIQATYGYTYEFAQEEFNRRMLEYEAYAAMLAMTDVVRTLDVEGAISEQETGLTSP